MAAILLLLTPGPAVLYIVARSVEQGRLAGLVSVCGITTGTLVHVLAAALGLSALLASSAAAFGVVKYAGAAYLVYIGARRILSRSEAPAERVKLPRRSLARLYRDGFIVNLLNPKTALFFLAFLPQFVDPSRGAAAFQIAFLGLLFALMGLISDGLYAVAAGAAGKWVRRNRASCAGSATSPAACSSASASPPPSPATGVDSRLASKFSVRPFPSGLGHIGFPLDTCTAVRDKRAFAIASLTRFGVISSSQAVTLTRGKSQGVAAGIGAFNACELPPPATRCRSCSQVRESGCLLFPWIPHDG